LQTAAENCAKAVLIKTAKEIPDEFFALCTVRITTGASLSPVIQEEKKEALPAREEGVYEPPDSAENKDNKSFKTYFLQLSVWGI